MSGATSSPATVTGLSAATAYDYRVAYTDATSTTVYSAVMTTTAVATTTYTVQAADLWDNGYDNVNAPRQSYVSRFIFTTNAASVTINGTTTLYSGYPAWSELGIAFNGATQSPPLVFTANGSQSFTVSGLTGTSTIEIISGLRERRRRGHDLRLVRELGHLPAVGLFCRLGTTVGNRILIYGDSIAVGADATYPETQGYIPILHYSYNFRTMAEAWGYRSLYDDANTGILLSRLRLANCRLHAGHRLAGHRYERLWPEPMKHRQLRHGLHAALLDALHAALPSAILVDENPHRTGE